MTRFPAPISWLGGLGGLLLLLWLNAELQNMPLLLGLGLGLFLLPVIALAYLFTTRSSPTAFSSWRKWGGFVLVLIAAFISAAFLLQNWQDEITRTRAARLISSLNSYRRTHGTFPDSLAQLAPTHLPAVPTTAYGAFLTKYPFHYTTIPPTDSTRAAFALSYSLGMMVETSYNSAHNTWQTYD